MFGVERSESRIQTNPFGNNKKKVKKKYGNEKEEVY